MIITRSPLRITLGGGGTDLPSYYRRRGGFLIAAAIDRYVYITLHQTFVDDLIVKYSKLERVRHARDLQHPIVREAFALLDMDGSHLEIASMADIPAGTGLGSSGSFTTALLRTLHAHRRDTISPGDLAEQACTVEIDRVGEPIGKQDQYIAAFGGVTCFHFNEDDTVDREPLPVSLEVLHNLEDNLLIFFTGYSRSAGTILQDQKDRTLRDDAAILRNLDEVKEIGKESHAALKTGDLRGFAQLMHEHWERKRRRSNGMSSAEIDGWYNLAMDNGALGGKLIGAGGGGFLMFYTEDRTRLRHAMRGAGLEEVRFRFDFEGTKVIVQ
jgi:D-glycero-alpha-D-manno-heptose-7-phosphate kinase